MDQHYSAFISYKHAPADIAVASEIQKRLERYHIPAEIRKKTGKDKVGRIFRDKEELPITSDLSDSISKALEDADYLIVICSSSTKLSTWVPREIDYFLKNHSKKQILTVLVDGEPADVIPKQLLTDSVTRTDPDGTTYEEEVIYEPLSCDFRTGLKEARRSEIPRLAAALLGCSYDELVRREHQYKRRRNLAIGIPAALALAIAIGYLVWSRQEISKNYQQAQDNLNNSLINQSSYLASESRKQLEKGDRFSAILLALEALPDKSADPGSIQATRPITRRARQALEKALNTYVAEGRSETDINMSEIAEFSMDNSISDYKATLDGHYVILLDIEGNVGVWDVESLSRIMLLDSVNVYDVQLMSDTQMVLLCGTGVISYDLPSKKEIWQIYDQNVNWNDSAICLSEAEKTIWVGESLKKRESDGVISENIQLLRLDASTGETTYRTMLVGENEEDSEFSVERLAYSEDGRWVAAALESNTYDNGAKLFLIDTETDTCSKLPLNKEYAKVDTMVYIKDDTNENVETRTAEQLVVMAYPLESYKNRTDTGLSGNSYLTQVRPMEIALSCYDLASSDLVWEKSFFSPQKSRIREGRSLFSFHSTEDLISIYGNKIALIQGTDGKIVDEIETTSSIRSGRVNENDQLILYLESGEIGLYRADDPGHVVQMSFVSFDLKSFTQINQFKGNVTDYLVAPDDKTIWLCREVYDDAFVRYKGPGITEDNYIKGKSIVRDTLTVLVNKNILYLCDLTEQNPIKVIEPPNEDAHYKILGGDNTAGVVWIESGDHVHLLALDVSSGTVQEYGEENRYISSPKLTQTGTLVYWIAGYPSDQLVAASLQNGILEETVLHRNLKRSMHYSVRPDLKAVVAEEENTVLRLTDLATGNDIRLEKILGDSLKQVVWQGTNTDSHTTDTALGANSLAITDGYEVVILNLDGTKVARLSRTGSQVINMTSFKNELIVLYSGGFLTRYSWTDGTVTGRSALAHYSSESFIDQVNWEFIDGTLYLTRYGTLDRLMHVINVDTWEEEEYFAYCLAFDTSRGRIVSYSIENNDSYLGYFPLYTVEDLRQKAKDVLHGTQLTDEERDSFGLK